MCLQTAEHPLSDAFAEGFAQLGNGKAGNNQLFWEGVQEAFAGQDEAHDNLHLQMMKF